MTLFASRHIEYVCRKCGKTVPTDKKLSHYCQVCGTLLSIRPFPKYWLFQFNPKIYRWFDRIASTQESEQWLASKHSKHMHEGDFTAIWASGEKAGIYAFGKIVRAPAIMPLNHAQTEYWVDKTGIDKFQECPSVMIEYRKIMQCCPLLAVNCHDNTLLKSLQVFMNPQGTNFKIEYEQWQEIGKLIENI